VEVAGNVVMFPGRTAGSGSEYNEQNSVHYGDNSCSDHDDHQGSSLACLSCY